MFSFTRTRNVTAPTFGNSKAAGIDFYIPNELDTTDISGIDSKNGNVCVYGNLIYFSNNIVLPSGIKVRMNKGEYLHLVNKSGIAAKKGIVLGACIIDEDYTGEIFFNLINTIGKPISIELGQKIVQGIVEKSIRRSSFVEHDNAEEMYSGFKSERGEGSQGSTGLK